MTEEELIETVLRKLPDNVDKITAQAVIGLLFAETGFRVAKVSMEIDEMLENSDDYKEYCRRRLIDMAAMWISRNIELKTVQHGSRLTATFPVFTKS